MRISVRAACGVWRHAYSLLRNAHAVKRKWITSPKKTGKSCSKPAVRWSLNNLYFICLYAKLLEARRKGKSPLQPLAQSPPPSVSTNGTALNSPEDDHDGTMLRARLTVQTRRIEQLTSEKYELTHRLEQTEHSIQEIVRENSSLQRQVYLNYLFIIFCKKKKKKLLLSLFPIDCFERVLCYM